MKTLIVPGCAVLLVLLGSCAPTPTTTATADTREADARALRVIETQWNQDWASRDVDTLVAHYADDAVLIGPGTPASSGKDAIRTTLKSMLSDRGLSLASQTSRVEVAKAGDMAYTQGTYSMTTTDSFSGQPVTDHGSYVTTYRKQPDGVWKAVVDIATSELAVVPPPAKR